MFTPQITLDGLLGVTWLKNSHFDLTDTAPKYGVLPVLEEFYWPNRVDMSVRPNNPFFREAQKVPGLSKPCLCRKRVVVRVVLRGG